MAGRDALEELARAARAPCATHAVLPRTLLGLPLQQVDGEGIGDRHDAQRHEEGGERAEDEEVAVEDGALLVAEQFVGARDAQRDDGACSGQRDHPHARNLGRDVAALLGARGEGVAHAEVAVDGDDAHVHDGGRAHHDVSHLVQRARDQTETPEACKKKHNTSIKPRSVHLFLRMYEYMYNVNS